MDPSEDRKSSPLLRACTLSVHDDGFCRQNVLVNGSLFPTWNLVSGTQLQVKSIITSLPGQGINNFAKTANDDHARRKSAGIIIIALELQFLTCTPARTNEASYVFRFEQLPSDLLAKHPSLEVR